MAARRIDLDDLRHEFTAQIDLPAGRGLAPRHVDTHQHLHLWPAVGEVVLEVAAAAGITACASSARPSRGPVGVTVRRLAAGSSAPPAPGASLPGHGAGLDEAGTLDRPRLVPTLERLLRTRGQRELATHPGEADDPERDRYRWGYIWDGELAALVDPEVRRRVSSLGFRLGTYADLGAAA